MKTTLRITGRGIISLPSKLRKALGIKPNGELIAEITPEGLLLRPAITLPVEMYSDDRIRELDDSEADLDTFLAKDTNR